MGIAARIGERVWGGVWGGVGSRLGGSREARVWRARVVAALLDDAVRIPGTRIGVGLDPVLGLWPVWGDLVGAAAAMYVVYEGWRLGATRWQVARMVANVAVDAAVGFVPVVGDVFDVAFNASTRNLRILGIEPIASR
jgi:hypothetical protein